MSEPLSLPPPTTLATDAPHALTELSTALADTRALYEVARAMSAQHDLGALLQTVVDSVAGALPAERVSLITFDLIRRKVTHFVRGGRGAELITLGIAFEELWQGLSGWVLRERRPALSPRGRPDPRELPNVQRRRAETRCGDIIVVPVIYQNVVLGTMTAINPPEGAAFARRQVDLMLGMASHAAAAMRTAQLYDEVRSRTQEVAKSLELEVDARQRAEAAERRLVASREQLAFALQCHQLGAWELNLNDRTITRSATHDQIFGYGAMLPIWTLDLLLEHVVPEDRPQVERSLAEAVATRTDWTFSCRIRRADGAHRHVFATLTHRPEGTGDSASMQGLLQDVTEQHRVEEMQYELSAVIEFATDAIITKSLAGIVRSWNPAAEQLLGFRAVDVLATPAAASCPEDRREEEARLLAQIAEGMAVAPMETLRRRSDGTLIDVSVSASPIRNRAGQVVGASMILRDITERKRAAEQFRLALEAAPTGMLLMDGTGIIVLVNAQAETLFGRRRHELAGRSLNLLLAERFRVPGGGTPEEFLSTAGKLGIGSGREIVGLHRDGTEIPIDFGLNPLQTRDGDFIIGSVVDLRSRHAVDRLRNDIISTVSHELRTPLTSITGSLGLLHSGALGALGPDAASMVRIAHQNSERLVRIINDILDIGKIDSDAFRLDMRPVALGELLQLSLDANAGLAAQQGVRFCLETPLEAATVLADPDRLMQVMANLLSNAVKVSIRTRRGENTVRIEVEDRGCGIPPEFRERIFERFAQVDASASRRFMGTGLGLSIARKLVDRMGGKIGVVSTVGMGSTFHVDLPSAGGARAGREG
jgi:PAS domain S-box-containing protein